MDDKAKVSCLECGATNNFPLAAVGRKVVCGRCGTALPIPGGLLELPPDRVMHLINNARLPVFLFFYSKTCSHCARMMPIVERLVQRRAGDMMADKISVGDHPELARHFNVRGFPTYVITRAGYERGRSSGEMPETDLSLWLASKL